ncbi:ferritin-like domain-containing protein [Sphingosinicella sp.]|uniref:ferritin-like domain-containing protein n=1 Tax=Sphingosinicella sp. TaxID=1917971 RepID=UPI0040384510
MIAAFRRRYLDLLGSIYIYNEHRGYTSIDRILEAARRHAPDDAAFIAAVEKHRADERKHYAMFKRWFELQGKMPLAIDRTCGHIDRFVEIMFRRRIDALDTDRMMEDDRLFERLCRVISLTERRGMQQVDIMLNHPIVRRDKVLMRIFRIIEQDEPSHWAPYDEWLRMRGRREAKWWERAIDGLIHSELIFLKLPILFFNPWLRRRTDWADTDDPAEAPASPIAAAT